MRARSTLPVGTGAWLGAVAGALVGLVDGARAAWTFGVAGKAAIAAVALSLAVDALAGLLGGAVVETLARLARWGRAVAAPAPARVVAFLVAAALSAGAAGETVAATATRNNRFLAAGLVALAALGAATLGALLAPALARVLGRRRAGEPEEVSASALLLFVPLVAAFGGVIVFALLWRTRAPLLGPVLLRDASRAGFAGACLPWALARTARVPVRIPWKGAAAAAGVVYGLGVARFVSHNWSDNLRFAPWLDLGVAAAIGVAAVVLLALFGAHLPRARGRVTAAAL
ncbi:MAG: hypothetical protein JWM82_2791, partial [Myxococcales bacterium]|nr:hypothetical protein [Myxococcales bacterium]